jgi:AraC family transcriptional regulator of adaptative response/methylated-DNA-[protein]-cysteine methyltransferase
LAARRQRHERTSDRHPAKGHHAARRQRLRDRAPGDREDQPRLPRPAVAGELAEDVGETPTGLQKLFTRWAGLSPKAFLQAVTLDHARKLLDEGMPLLEASL